MATQNCPKCKKDSFTWSIDEEENRLTQWYCNNCGYTALEDELLESVCSNCGTKNNMRLKDEIKEYWWCNNCNIIAEVVF